MTNNLALRFAGVLLVVMLPVIAAAQPAEKRAMRKANSQYRAEKFTDAEVNYRKALEIDSTMARARYNLGNALLSQRKPKDAMVEYEKAAKIEKNPFYKAAIYHNMGVILQSQKQFGPAIECYKESLRNYPEDDRTRYNLALCQHQLKNQPQQDQQQQQNDQDQNDQKENEQQKPDEQQNKQQQPQPQKDEMSKENAEQMLQAAMMQENRTQDKVRKAQQQARRRNNEKNW